MTEEELHSHFEDVFQLLDDVCTCMQMMNSAAGSPSNVIPDKIQSIKGHISQASAFLEKK